MQSSFAILLSAGLGTRLRPLTDVWPKCLMPINKRPLLSYWLANLELAEVDHVAVNTHWLSDIVDHFIAKYRGSLKISTCFEKELLGTAGTIRKMGLEFAVNSSTLIAHSDNFSNIDIKKMLAFHASHSAPITMAVFNTNEPEKCGVVVTNEEDIVVEFQEKEKDPKSTLANGAIYIFNPEVFEFLYQNPELTDISTQVIPNYLGKIKIFRHTGFLIDVGTIENLRFAQDILREWKHHSLHETITAPYREKFEQIIRGLKCREKY